MDTTTLIILVVVLFLIFGEAAVTIGIDGGRTM